MAEYIYIVTAGEYSDYHIDAVFSTEEKAKAYCDAYGDDVTIEKFPIDSEEPCRNLHLWKVAMNIDNKEVRLCSPQSYYKTWKDLVKYVEEREQLCLYIEGDSAERVKKVASERFGAIIANEQTFYPYLRKDIIHNRYLSGLNDYPHYDFHTGEIVLIGEERLVSSFYTKSIREIQDMWESGRTDAKQEDFLPAGVRVRHVKSEGTY